MTAPTLIKTEFWGGPCDGDKRRVVPNRDRLSCFDTRDDATIHVYAYSTERRRMEYVGLAERSSYDGTPSELRVGTER
jgi:hypothetical protein